MSSSRDRVFAVVKKHICDVLPDVDASAVPIEAQLSDLGANSIDRADIVVQSMNELGVRVPPAELGRVRNIAGLVDVLVEKLAADARHG